MASQFSPLLPFLSVTIVLLTTLRFNRKKVTANITLPLNSSNTKKEWKKLYVHVVYICDSTI